MEHSIHINGNNHIDAGNISIDVPERCPLCEQNMSPIVFDKAVISDYPIATGSGSDVFQVSFIARCTRCKHLYTNIFNVSKNNYGFLSIDNAVYHQTKTPNINIKLPEVIKKISPKFVKIYTQALQAEKLNLDELAGMGLRKAIEFLIKDYAIKNNRENEQKIKSQYLGNTIKEFIDDNDLQILAEGATWIANDETHYAIEWPNKDIEDIKKYIECFIGHIELKSNIADIQDMREKRKRRKEQNKIK